MKRKENDMDDLKIIELFFARDEKALSESQKKYGRYCQSISRNILSSDEDAEEVLNDTLLSAWNSIPPEEPKSLKTYLGTLARNLSLDRYRKLSSEKRGGREVSLCIEEAEEFLADTVSVEEEYERRELSKFLNNFLHSLPLVSAISSSADIFTTTAREILRENLTSRRKTSSSSFREREKS